MSTQKPPPKVVAPDGFTMNESQMRRYVTTVAERFPDEVAARIDVEGRWYMMDGPPAHLEQNRMLWAIANGEGMAMQYEQAIRMRNYAALFPSNYALADDLAEAAEEIIQDVSRATQIYRRAAAATNIIGHIALQSARQAGLEMAGAALADLAVPGAGALIEGGAAVYGGAETAWKLGPIAVPAATTGIMLYYTYTHLDDPEYLQQMSRMRWR